MKLEMNLSVSFNYLKYRNFYKNNAKYKDTRSSSQSLIKNSKSIRSFLIFNSEYFFTIITRKMIPKSICWRQINWKKLKPCILITCLHREAKNAVCIFFPREACFQSYFAQEVAYLAYYKNTTDTHLRSQLDKRVELVNNRNQSGDIKGVKD